MEYKIENYLENEILDIDINDLPDWFFEREEYEKMEFCVEIEENGGYAS